MKIILKESQLKKLVIKEADEASVKFRKLPYSIKVEDTKMDIWMDKTNSIIAACGSDNENVYPIVKIRYDKNVSLQNNLEELRKKVIQTYSENIDSFT